MDKSLRIGITAVGSGIGQSIVNSCRLSSLPLHLIGFDVSAMAYGACDCHEQYTLPPSLSPEYADALLAACKKHGVDLLIPGLDLDLTVISENAPRFESEGIKVLIGGIEFIRLCRDKLLWSRTLREVSPHILPGFDLTECTAAIDSGHIFFPLIAKPLGGSGSVGLRILNAKEDLVVLQGEYVVQPYVMPFSDDPDYSAISKAIAQKQLIQLAEISCQWLVSRDGEVLGHMATRNRLKDGVPIEIIIIDDTPYWEALQPIIPLLQSRGMRGPVNIQGRMTTEGPRFFEMNGRFTGITGLRALQGFNEVDLAIRSFMDLPAPPSRLKVNSRRVGLRQVAERVASVIERPDLKAQVQRVAPTADRSSKRHVLVTGATGWLGRHLVSALLGRESIAAVYVLVRSQERANAIWPMTDPRLHFWLTDELEERDTRFSDVDAIFHLAMERNPADSASHARNVALTRQLSTAAICYHIPRFVHVSSQSVYGTTQPPLWSEDLPVSPENTYAMGKWAGEQMTAMVSALSHATRATSVRLARLYGAADGLRWSELPHKFARDAMMGSPLSIFGGKQVFDLIHVRDAVNALLRLLDSTLPTWEPVYNIGGCSPVTISEIAEAAIAAAGRIGRTGSFCDITPSDVPGQQFGMDCSLFQRDTGWCPSIFMEQAMDELVFATTQWSQSRG